MMHLTTASATMTDVQREEGANPIEAPFLPVSWRVLEEPVPEPVPEFEPEFEPDFESEPGTTPPLC